MKEQRSYSAELKAEAVKMVIEQGLTQKETGKRLSIPKGNIGNWVSAAKAGLRNGSPGEQSVAELSRENARLRKELAEARMEREILPLVMSTTTKRFSILCEPWPTVC
jgi:transposase-like protein